MCGQCGSGLSGTWALWVFWYSVAMTIDDQESAGAARPGHGAGGHGCRHGHGALPGAGAGAAARTMSMSMIDLDKRCQGYTVSLRIPCPGAHTVRYLPLLSSLVLGSWLLPAPPHTGVQSSGCKNAPSHSPSHPDLTIARDQASILSTKPTSPPKGGELHRAELQSGHANDEQDALDWIEPCNVPTQGISPTPCRQPASQRATTYGMPQRLTG